MSGFARKVLTALADPSGERRRAARDATALDRISSLLLSASQHPETMLGYHAGATLNEIAAIVAGTGREASTT